MGRISPRLRLHLRLHTTEDSHFVHHHLRLHMRVKAYLPRGQVMKGPHHQGRMALLRHRKHVKAMRSRAMIRMSLPSVTEARRASAGGPAAAGMAAEAGGADTDRRSRISLTEALDPEAVRIPSI
jgi:hypothetical protein